MSETNCATDGLTLMFRGLIRKQKAVLRKSGVEPTWSVFSDSFGWHQMRQGMSADLQRLYEELWREDDGAQP